MQFFNLSEFFTCCFLKSYRFNNKVLFKLVVSLKKEMVIILLFPLKMYVRIKRCVYMVTHSIALCGIIMFKIKYF